MDVPSPATTQSTDHRVARVGQPQRRRIDAGRRAMSQLALLAMVTVFTACGHEATVAPVETPTAPVTTTHVVVTPTTTQLTAGLTTTLTASVRDQRDAVVAGASIAWTSSNIAVATVSTSGVVSAVSAGVATITAQAGTAVASAAVTVVAVPTAPASEFQTAVPVIDLNVVLSRPANTSVTASIYSGVERDVTVAWTPGGSTVAHVVPGHVTDVDITGLAADRAYSYSATSGATSVSGNFRTARVAGSTYRFVMQADSHLDGNSDTKIYTNTLANIAADTPDFMIDLGDTFMTDKYPVYTDAAPQYYAQRYYLGLTGRTVPLYLVQGNHDGELGWLNTVSPWAANERTRYFPTVRADAFYATNIAPRNYYAWVWGDATFIVLDPFAATSTQPSRAPNNWAWTLGREQYDWLSALLQRTTTQYTFVFLHNLVGGQTSEARGGAEASRFWEWGGQNADGSPGFATQRAGWAKPIHDLFVQYKVSAVFHGHDHLYVHQERDGIAYQEVPQPSFARENATSSAADYGYVSGTLFGSSGHMRVTVTPTKATVEYIRSRLPAGNGDVVDRYDIKPASQR